jgi:hypothetical protein
VEVGKCVGLDGVRDPLVVTRLAAISVLQRLVRTWIAEEGVDEARASTMRLGSDAKKLAQWQLAEQQAPLAGNKSRELAGMVHSDKPLKLGFL